MRADGHCRSCKQPIRWAVHEVTGRRMPLDPGSRVDGNVAIVEWRNADPLGQTRQTYALPVVVVNLKHPERAVTRYRYVSHFATCPNAARHRKKGS